MRAARSIIVVTLSLGLGGCASVIPGKDYPKSSSITRLSADETSLAKHFREASRQHGNHSGFRMLSAGVDGFLSRIEMINAAERTLDLQYYIFRGDETGTLIREALRKAARRGVRIRVLVDDADTRPGDENLFELASVQNIEIRIFNPWIYRGHIALMRTVEFLFRHPRLDYRMHNKLLVVDDAAALVGGRNVGDQYFQIDPASQFADDDIFAVGPAVPELEHWFDEYWNSELAIPSQALVTRSERIHRGSGPRKPHLTDSELEQAGFHYHEKLAAGEPFAGIFANKTPLVWSDARVICDSPYKRELKTKGRAASLMYQPVAAAVSSVQHELLMITPYFVPSPAEMKLLESRRAQNAKVAILTNSLESAPELSAHAGYIHYRRALLSDGVELFETRARLESTRGSGQSAEVSRFGNYALHGKLIVFDRTSLYAGSMNFDRRSRYLNTEMGLIIDSPELSLQTVSRFDAMTQPASAYRVLLESSGSGNDAHLVWRTREHDRIVEYRQEPARSMWQRLKARLLSLLPLDSEL